MSIQYPAPLSRGIAWWPTVYDCISAIAAKRCGYNRVYFAAASLSLSLYGTKDTSVLSPDTYIRAISNLRESTDQKIMVDISLSGLPFAQAKAFALRAVKAGADMLVLTTGKPEAVQGTVLNLLDAHLPLGILCTGKSSAADLPVWHLFLEHGISFYGYADADAWLPSMQDDKYPGKKLLCLSESNHSINCETLAAKNCNDVIFSFTEAGTVKAMEDFALHTLHDQNTVYHDQHDFDGMLHGHDYHDIFDFGTKWLTLEQNFYNEASTR